MKIRTKSKLNTVFLVVIVTGISWGNWFGLLHVIKQLNLDSSNTAKTPGSGNETLGE